MFSNLLSDDDSNNVNKPTFDNPSLVKGKFLTIYYSNLDTLSNKKEEIIDMANTESPDIMVFNELLNKSDPKITKAELKIKGYDTFYHDDTPEDKVNKRRGVVIYTKEYLNGQYYSGFDDLGFRENIWCSFKTCNNQTVLVGNVYHSGSSSEINTSKLYDILKSPNHDSFDHTLICGDFNFPTVNWNGVWSNEKDEQLLEAMREGFLTQHISRPTRYKAQQKPNILDLVFTKDDSDINNIYYCSPLGKSDHILLKLITSIPTKKHKPSVTYRYDWKNGNYVEFKKFMSSVDWSKLKELNVEECWRYIKNKLEEGIKLYVPLVKCTSETKDKPPWFTFEVKKSVKKKYKLFKLFLESEDILTT